MVEPKDPQISEPMQRILHFEACTSVKRIRACLTTNAGRLAVLQAS